MPLDSVSKCLFYWSAKHGATPLIGGKPVHSRGSAARWVDGQGILQDAIVNTPRFEHATISGERRPVMRLEEARTNILQRSEDLGSSPWTVTGTPTRTGGIDFGVGVLFDLVGDDNGATAETFDQTVAFTGDGAKAVSLHMKKGTSPAASGTYLRLRDNTAAADRLGATVTWNADGSPNVSLDFPNTYLGSVPLGAGVYRLLFRTEAVVAANSHQFRIYPALTGTETGNVHVGGGQIENALNPSSYIKTPGSASVTRAADVFYFDFPPAPQAMMVYLRFVERGAWVVTDGRPLEISGSSGLGPRFIVFPQGNVYRAFHQNSSGGGAVSVALAVSPAFGDTVELVALLLGTGAVGIIQSINGAAVTSPANSAAHALATDWSGPRLKLTQAGLTDHAEIKIVKYADVVAATAQGIMDELRAFEIAASGEVIS